MPGHRCGFFKWADNAPSSAASRAMKWRRFTPPRFKLVSGAGSSSSAHSNSDGGGGGGGGGSAGAGAGSGVGGGGGSGVSVGSFRPADVRQGAVGDCWLLSALAVVAERQDLVARVVGPSAHPAASRHGAFLLRLFLGGRWRAVVVDPHLPISGRATKVLRGANAAGSRGGDEFALAYSRAADNQLWVPLVEKAYAKAHGSYHAISGGWISEGLLDLTGCPTETIELDAPEGFDSERAWLRMLSYATAGQGPFNQRCSPTVCSQCTRVPVHRTHSASLAIRSFPFSAGSYDGKGTMVMTLPLGFRWGARPTWGGRGWWVTTRTA